MIDGLEKRKFQRLAVPLEITLEVISAQNISKGQPLTHVRSRDISKGGICLETKSLEISGVNLLEGPPFARDNCLRLSIEIDPNGPPLMATGEVVWYNVEQDIPEFIFRLGVAFIDISEDGKDRLAEFLKKHRNYMP